MWHDAPDDSRTLLLSCHCKHANTDRNRTEEMPLTERWRSQPKLRKRSFGLFAILAGKLNFYTNVSATFGIPFTTIVFEFAQWWSVMISEIRRLGEDWPIQEVNADLKWKVRRPRC